jgi:hypothetical protein
MITGEYTVTFNAEEQRALKRVLEAAKAGKPADPKDRALVDAVAKRAQRRVCGRYDGVCARPVGHKGGCSNPSQVGDWEERS